MKKIFATLVSSSVLAASFTLLSAPANAATFKRCIGTNSDNKYYNLEDNVSGTSDCRISETPLGNDSEEKVNQAGFFHKTDWIEGRKLDNIEATQGTWDIGVIKDTWQDVMLIFKGGSDSSGTRLVGYKVDKDKVEQDGGIITWQSPFEKAAFEEYVFKGKNTKDVSHISLYYTETSTPPKQEVPEPVSLFGLGVVGGAMVLSRRRRLNRQLSGN
ncbi:MAG: PEP-CTERM sorting domain-containing protein [Calothrix sp. MO_167.B12]|nr:PEP-CTERM sorting domain-containing protein [Calothrix sp. MO_167.B12]